MTNPTRRAKRPQSQIEADRWILNSARGWLVYLCEFMTDFQATIITRPDLQKQSDPENVFELPVKLLPAFFDLAPPVELRGNIPEQMAARFRLWANRLNEMADEVLTVPAEQPYKHMPKAYVSREASTGDFIGARLSLAESKSLVLAYEEIMHSDTLTGIDDADKYPELKPRVDKMLQAAGVLAG